MQFVSCLIKLLINQQRAIIAQIDFNSNKYYFGNKMGNDGSKPAKSPRSPRTPQQESARQAAKQKKKTQEFKRLGINQTDSKYVPEPSSNVPAVNNTPASQNLSGSRISNDGRLASGIVATDRTQQIKMKSTKVNVTALKSTIPAEQEFKNGNYAKKKFTTYDFNIENAEPKDYIKQSNYFDEDGDIHVNKVWTTPDYAAYRIGDKQDQNTPQIQTYLFDRNLKPIKAPY